jgi:Cof subfamily protein (haloacid dehalogenase superfamily)
MPIRLLAVDLDGTLLNSQAEISEANRKALGEAASRGVEIVVVTGRRFQSAQPLVQQIGFPVTLIASNGALIGISSGEVLRRNFLPRSVALEVLEAARGYREYAVAVFDLPSRGQVVMETGASSEGPLDWYLSKSPEALGQVPDLEEAIASDPVQIMFGGPPSRLESLEDLLRASPAGCKVHLTWTKYFSRNMSLLDVMNRGCSKRTSLEFWTARCGIPPSQVMAIGDNYNDLEMLQFAGHPVVMRNCTPGLDLYGWPVTLTNDQDGVAVAIQTHILM